jgi:hypothetical protein
MEFAVEQSQRIARVGRGGVARGGDLKVFDGFAGAAFFFERAS